MNYKQYIIDTLRKYVGRSRLDFLTLIAEMRDYIDLNIINKRNVKIILFPEEKQIIDKLTHDLTPEKAVEFLDKFSREIEKGEVIL